MLSSVGLWCPQNVNYNGRNYSPQQLFVEDSPIEMSFFDFWVRNALDNSQTAALPHIYGESAETAFAFVSISN